MTRVVTFNIQFGVGRDGKADLSRAIEALRGADVACLQEIERGFRRDDDDDQPERIAAAFPGYWYVFAPNLNVHWTPTRADAPHRAGFRRQHGEMILSRYPIRDTRTFILPRGPSQIFSQQRILLEAVIDCPDGPFRLYTTHLCHLGPESRRPQIERIVDIVNDHGRGPTWTGTVFPEAGWNNDEAQPPWPEDFVFCGDLNVLPGSDEYSLFTSVWRDATQILSHSGDQPTLVMPDRPHRRLDYFFMSDGMARRLQSYHVASDCIASDHVPVSVDFKGVRNQSSEQEGKDER